MKKVVITVDSTSDFPAELAKETGVIVINQPIFMGGKTYTDNVDITPEAIIKYADETGDIPKTSCPSYQQYKDTWTPHLEAGSAIMHFNLSSELGANYSNACLAAKEFQNVYVVDSQTATCAIGLLILHALDLLAEGKDVKEVYEKVLAKREKTHLSIMLENMRYMRKSGRCTAVQLIASSLLKIRIELQLIDGKLKVANKHKGNMQHAIKAMVASLDEKLRSADKKIIFVGRIGKDNTNTEFLQQYMRENYKFERVYPVVAGSTITCHIGDGGIGLIFFKG